MKKYVLLICLVSLLWCAPYVYAAPVVWTVNGHYYDVVSASITWDDAKKEAETLEYNGISGKLVTIESAAENLFLTDAFITQPQVDLLNVKWIGGYQEDGAAEPAGGWKWIGGTDIVFDNWAGPGEPNNGGGTEDRIVFDHGITAEGQQWNDLTGTWEARGYVVEYESAPVPEPSMIALLGLSFAGFFYSKR